MKPSNDVMTSHLCGLCAVPSLLCALGTLTKFQFLGQARILSVFLVRHMSPLLDYKFHKSRIDVCILTNNALPDTL